MQPDNFLSILPRELLYEFILYHVNLIALLHFAATSRAHYGGVYSHGLLWSRLLFPASLKRRFMITDSLIEDIFLRRMTLRARRGVRTLDLSGTMITLRGLQVIVGECKGLEQLRVEDCVMLSIMDVTNMASEEDVVGTKASEEAKRKVEVNSRRRKMLRDALEGFVVNLQQAILV